MRLGDLLKGLSYEVISGNTDIEISGVKNNSRNVSGGDLFFCIRGNNTDGHSYAACAACKGAAAVIAERDVKVAKTCTVIRVPDTRYAMGIISSSFYGCPSDKLTVIGITGTKGKTTTAYMIYDILNAAGIKTGLIGTVETDDGRVRENSEHTTPESTDIQRLLSQMVQNKVSCAVMEVSSQGLMMKRVLGVNFDIGIFTNLSKDHIGPGEHKSFEEYKEYKKKLFSMCRVGIINADSPFCCEIARDAECEVFTYGMSPNADYRAESLEFPAESGFLGVSYNMGGRLSGSLSVNMPGEFTVYNSLAAAVAADIMGIGISDIKKALMCVKVKGRTEMINISDDFTLMIDYAHNKSSVEQLIGALRVYGPARLVILFGCGGNRSPDRRYGMGAAAARLADKIIITNDNPRFEEPMDIIRDIEKGVCDFDGDYVIIPDRKEAIRYALLNAVKGDVIVLCGKGHENYQDIRGTKHYMDERVLIGEILEEEDVTKICGYNNRYFA